MTKAINFTTLLLFISLIHGCGTGDVTQLKGYIDYTGSSELYIEKQPLHYKYSAKEIIPVEPDNNGNFSATIPGPAGEVVFFTIDDATYPIILKPGQTLEMRVQRAYYPDSVAVSGYSQDWNRLYIRYREEEKMIMRSISGEVQEFREGNPNDLLDLYKERIKVAKRFLGDTPLDLFYHKAIGEYLVKRLENIKYRREQPEFNPERERDTVIEQAKEWDFFTYEVLKDQRAGIRDFTNAYANTFGVEKRIEQKYGQELMQYDVKRLGYETLDSARTSVLTHIDQRKALAYAKMHLIAERIGEMSPEAARPSYTAYLKNFDDFPTYTNFLQEFYEDVKSVSPGQPAVPFSLTSQYGKTVRMKDFRGTYVLLDFWASWCIPCLDEFPHMKKLYQEYSRDDFEIVGISIEEDSLKWRQAIQRFNNPWIQLYGGNGFDQETFKAYKGGGIPFYILVDREGKILRYNDARPSFNLPEILDSLITTGN